MYCTIIFAHSIIVKYEWQRLIISYTITHPHLTRVIEWEAIDCWSEFYPLLSPKVMLCFELLIFIMSIPRMTLYFDNHFIVLMWCSFESLVFFIWEQLALLFRICMINNPKAQQWLIIWQTISICLVLDWMHAMDLFLSMSLKDLSIICSTKS